LNELVLLGLLLLNFGISAWNAYAAGAYLTESRIIGGWIRVVTWCALVMSACGFTWVYLTVLTIGAVAFGKLDPYWADIAFKLGYLALIGPVLGSGLGIWAHSLAEAYRRRSFGSAAVAAWNTYAQVSNAWDAARHAPGFLDDVLKAFGGRGRKSKDDGALMVVLLFVLALAAGAITTGAIARWADRRVAMDVGRVGRG
jgi:hypothetical protein